MRIIALAVILLLLALFLNLFITSLPVFKEFGLGFIISREWNPSEDSFGALPFIFGTFVTAIFSLLIAGVPCVALALFIIELKNAKLYQVFKFSIEMLAAIPSIIYGMWALVVVSPFVKDIIYPFIHKIFPTFFLFKGPSFGIGILVASIVLAIMISPIITSFCIEVFKSIPVNQKMSALALGFTRFEMYKVTYLSAGKKVIWGAMLLALGRALGETMAVTMVIGNNPKIQFSLFATGSTMASAIANEYAEAFSELHMSALSALGLLLFVMTVLINTFAKSFILKEKK